MPIDLEHLAPRPEPFRSQVCVIGAGIAGLTLAHRLAKQGIDVALLEAGGLTLEPAGQSLLSAAHLAGTPHAGTHEGRFRAYGGASLRWGGQLLPMSPSHPAQELSSRPESALHPPSELSSRPESAHFADAAERPAVPGLNLWPITPETLQPYDTQAETLLGVDQLPYDAAPFFAATSQPTPTLFNQLATVNPRLSKWAPFARRNMADTLGRELLASPHANVYLHAQATELVLAPNGTHLEAVHVRTLSGSTFRFEAQHFVLAAGTVETVRLMLASRSVSPAGVGNDHDQLGRNFHDHLTLPAAELTGPTRAAVLAPLRPWVYGSTVHSLKLEASASLCRRLNLNPALAHFTLEDTPDSGLAVVRTLLTSRQQGSFLSSVASNLPSLPAAATEVVRLAWAARMQHRRHVPSSTKVRIQLNLAQDANSASRITLSSNLDPFGLPQPIVDWRITEHETQNLRDFAVHLRNRFDHLSLWEGAQWNSDLFTPSAPLRDLGDARHAMGGAIMGDNPRTSVVDPNLTVHGVANLHIASAATFPTGAPQLATLTLMSLSLRLADRLASPD